ncbi:hypothetical protein K438DRAFT_695397 [Mycena galopus ATCC 62051]|nr:hypothetical protein K438DRAFT_695397 [Mycena galopus ATCC 62051]
MGEIALINLDKCEVVDPSETGHGFKLIEAIANWTTEDILWMFTVPADNQPVPTPAPLPPAQASHFKSRSFDGVALRARVPVGHWAGDRVVIVDHHLGSAQSNFPPELLARFPAADPQETALQYALAHLTHVGLAKYEPADGNDALFPAARVWVVRNLTQRWYARADALVAPAHRRGPAVTDDAEELGLSDLIWAEIGGGRSVGGYTAGHRFDITTLDAVEGADSVDWVDRSKDAKETLVEFYYDEVRELRG